MKKILFVLLVLVLFTGCAGDKKELYLPEAKNDKIYTVIKDNDGEYEKSEQKRIDKLNASIASEGEEISLTTLLEINKDKCDKIEFSLFGKQENYEIDKEVFFSLADEILLKSVKNTLASSNDSFVINAYEGEKIYSVNMWDDCKVGSKRTAMYSAPTGDYVIKVADYERLTELFPEEAKPELSKLKSTYANFAYWVVDNPMIAYTIGALALIILVGAIGFIIGYKVRKKKARG